MKKIAAGLLLTLWTLSSWGFHYRSPRKSAEWRLTVKYRSNPGSTVDLRMNSLLLISARSDKSDKLQLFLKRFDFDMHRDGRRQIELKAAPTRILYRLKERVRFHRKPAGNPSIFRDWFGKPFARLALARRSLKLSKGVQHPSTSLGALQFLRYFLMSHPPLPSKALKRGLSWLDRLDLPRGQGLKRDVSAQARFNVVGRVACAGSKRCWRIRFRLEPTDFKAKSKKGTLQITYSGMGEALLDPARGQLESGKLQLRMLVRRRSSIRSSTFVVSTTANVTVQRVNQVLSPRVP